jgi:pyruvate dehydrogenase E1 component beta subunit
MPPASHPAADVVASVLDDLVSRDAAVLVVGEERGGTADDRHLVLPVSDRGTLGVAWGLALAGRKPVVQLSGTSRLAAVIEVLAEAGAAAARGDAVTLVVRVPYGTEAEGLDRPVGPLLAALAGVDVVCASAGASAAGLLRWAVSRSTPTLVLEPRGLRATSTDHHAATLVRQGRHVTLAAWGHGVSTATDAADQLARDGIDADVIDLVSLQPIDRTLLGERVRTTGRLVVVHPDDPVMARLVHEAALDEAFLHLESPLSHIAGDAQRVAAAARDSVHF